MKIELPREEWEQVDEWLSLAYDADLLDLNETEYAEQLVILRKIWAQLERGEQCR